MWFYESIYWIFKLSENQIKSYLIGNKNDKKIILNKQENGKIKWIYKIMKF